jgi:hypothetical protein
VLLINGELGRRQAALREGHLRQLWRPGELRYVLLIKRPPAAPTPPARA